MTTNDENTRTEHVKSCGNCARLGSKYQIEISTCHICWKYDQWIPKKSTDRSQLDE